MAPRHSLLERQLRRHFGAGAAVPAEWQALLDSVSAAYAQADHDRAMIEHSLDTVSREMLDRYHRLERQKASNESLVLQKQRAEELALLNAAQVAALRASSPDDVIAGMLDCTATMCGAAGAAAWIPSRSGWVLRARWRGATPATIATLTHWGSEPRTEDWLLARLDTPEGQAVRCISTGHDAMERALLLVIMDGDGVGLLNDEICRLLSAQLSASLREKRIEQAYHAGAELLRAVTEGAQDAICAKDRDGRYLSCNPAAAHMLGRTIEAVLGRRDRELFGAAAAEREHLEDQAVLASGQPIVTEHRRGGPAGERLLLTSKAPLRGVDGSVTGVVSITSDVTDRAMLEQRLHQAEKMESLGLMAGGLAHDFNNLLTIISGNCSLLSATPVTSAERDEAIGEIQAAATRAAEVTRQLLTFSRRQVVKTERLDLRALLTERALTIRNLLGETVACGFLLPDSRLDVEFDPVQMEQVILNLAMNARRGLPDGGTLTIELRAVPLSVETAAAHGVPPGEYVVLTFRDDGIGLDEAARARAFEPFYLTRPEAKGEGLGLPMVYGAIAAAGGAVAVESTPGLGTAFSLFIPRAPASGTATVPGQRAPDGVLQASDTAASREIPQTILLVEDERAVRHVARLVLSHAGYRVLEARHGEDALRLITGTSDHVDLLLTDVVMPTMGGGALSVHFRALRPGVPVLFMSGYSDDAIVRDGVARTETHFLTKPFTGADLLTAVGRAIGAARSAAVRSQG